MIMIIIYFEEMKMMIIYARDKLDTELSLTNICRGALSVTCTCSGGGGAGCHSADC